LTKRALWVIERNLDRDLSLTDLAAACDVSRCHLSHAFTERVGRPITDYVRSRRLSSAAEALAAGAPDILDLALASGYNSHEAFSRAFKTLLGVTPESVRRRRTTAGLPLVSAIDMTTAEERTLPMPEVTAKGAMTFVGLFDRFTLDTTHGIPALWRRFMASYGDIEDKVDPIPVGVIGPIGEDGCFAYGCAAQVGLSAAPPASMSVLNVPAQRYALFPHLGHVSTIRSTYDAIWNQVLSENGWTTPERPGLERHHPTFNPLTGEGGVTIWIPVLPVSDGARTKPC
jgi:AraC family transcriptional regulator